MVHTLGTRRRLAAGMAVPVSGARGDAQRGGTGPWAQGPVRSPAEVVPEDNFGNVVPVSSVDLARSSGSPQGDPG